MPEGFVKVEGGATEQVTETTSLMVAYSAIWLILMAFTLVTFRALRSLRAQAERADKAVPISPEVRSFGAIFIVLWLLLLAFVFVTRRKQRLFRAEVERLEAALGPEFAEEEA